MSELRLSARDVWWRYDEEAPWVLEGINIDVPAGQTTLLAGPSGSGKSTLAMIMAGLIKPEHGDVMLNGRPIGDMTAAERAQRIGVVFQNADLQFCMDTLRHELIFCLENQAWNPGQMDSRVEEIAHRVGVRSLLDRTLMTLSGGEKQRASLACALVGGADTLVLDEPFANLDPSGRCAMIEVLANLQSARELTILAIDHDGAPWERLRPRRAQIGARAPAAEVRRRRHQPGAVILSMRQLKLGIPAPRSMWAGVVQRPWIDGPALMEVPEFSLQEREIAAILGPSGCGKSTLLRALIRQHPVHGDVQIDGRYLTSIPAGSIGRTVGMVFQNPADQFVALRAEDDVALAATADTDVAALMERFRLGYARTRSPFTLSQGEQRRLAVLSMMVTRQRLLLLDEPTYGQDAASTDAMMALIAERAEQNNAGVLMVTHDENLAHRWADSVWRVRDHVLTRDRRHDT